MTLKTFCERFNINTTWRDKLIAALMDEYGTTRDLTQIQIHIVWARLITAATDKALGK